MTSSRTYLDHNASSPLRPEAKAAMLAALDHPGNASSVHQEGRAAREIVETAREQVARLVGAKTSEVVFTSGATEANCWALANGWTTVLVGATEHDSVLAPAQALPARTVEIPVAPDGVCLVDLLAEQLARTTGGDRERPLIAIQWANNETGVIQPVAEIATLAANAGVAFHCDAVQAAGRVAIGFGAATGITTLSVSAHKLGGPKGIGALVVRDGTRLAPLLSGGGQERRRRAGTENVAAIAGFGAAASAASLDLEGISTLSALRDDLIGRIKTISPEAVIFGAAARRLANTVCVALPGYSAETLLIRMDLAGVAVSSGAACSSGKVGPSHVLAAMGVADPLAKCTIRASFGWNSSKADLEAFLTAWALIASPQRRSRSIA